MLLLDMMRWNEKTLYPISSFKYGFFDGGDFLNYVMTLYSLTDCQYNEPPLFQQMCENFMNVHGRQIKAMVDAIEASKDIDFNTFGYTHITDTSGENAGSSKGENESRVSAFNTSGYSPDNSGNSSASSNANYKENKSETHNEKVKGSEVLRAIEARKNLAVQNLYLKAAEWFADELLICVW